MAIKNSAKAFDRRSPRLAAALRAARPGARGEGGGNWNLKQTCTMCASAKISAAVCRAPPAAAKKVHGHALSWKLKCVHRLGRGALVSPAIICTLF